MKKVVILAIVITTSLLACKTQQKNACIPKPDPNCACAMIYQPVCGCDGKTYGNACEAGCAKIEIVSQGACPK